MKKLQIIGEEIFHEEEKKNYLHIINNHIRMTEIFSSKHGDISEIENDTNIRNDVINKINNDDWENTTPALFKQSVSKSGRKEMLSDYDIHDLKNMKLFKLNGYDIGFALKNKNGKFTEIVSVFNNDPIVRNIGKELIAAAIRNGGCELDHFDGFLTNFYKSLGFIEYKREPFNHDYPTTQNFINKYGAQDIIYRIHEYCM